MFTEARCSPTVWNLTKPRVKNAIRKKVKQLQSKPEATADGFGRLAAHLGAHRIEVHEPGFEDCPGHALQGFVDAVVQFDLVVEGTKYVGCRFLELYRR